MSRQATGIQNCFSDFKLQVTIIYFIFSTDIHLWRNQVPIETAELSILHNKNCYYRAAATYQHGDVTKEDDSILEGCMQHKKGS